MVAHHGSRNVPALLTIRSPLPRQCAMMSATRAQRTTNRAASCLCPAIASCTTLALNSSNDVEATFYLEWVMSALYGLQAGRARMDRGEGSCAPPSNADRPLVLQSS